MTGAPPRTWAEALRLAAAAGLPRLDADLLLGRCCGASRSALIAHPHTPLAPPAAERFRDLVARHRQGEPLAYLLGDAEFHGLTLRTTPDTLIPRPDTEVLVDAVLALPLPARTRLLDLGTGSGAVALALLQARRHWCGVATDLSAAALAIAEDNAHRHALQARLQLRCGDWFAATPDERFELIVANPPYVAEHSPHLHEDVARFEPATALFAGPDGLQALRILIAGAPAHLQAGGWLGLEHGFDQAQAVALLLVEAGFEAIESHRDAGGHLRATLGRWPAAGSAS